MSAYHQIRALYDRDTITVYQAYNQQIAQLAVQQQKFVSPFSFHRNDMDKTFIFMAKGKKSLGNKIQPKSYFGNPYQT